MMSNDASLQSEAHVTQEHGSLGQSRTDHPLPGLPDREAFMRRLDMSIRMAERQRACFAVLQLELGREADVSELDLQGAAVALRATVRLTDTLASLGAGLFGVLINVANEEGAFRVASKITEALGGALGPARAGRAVIGMAMYPQHGHSAELLMNAVSRAFYRASRGQHGTVMAAGAELASQDLRAGLGLRMGHAIEQNEFVLRFQPVVSLQSGLPVGAEALARWRHPDLGLLPPVEFLHLASTAAAQEALALSLLDQALLQIGDWRERALGLNLSLNLSPVLLGCEALDQKILARFRAHGLSPDCLSLELRDEGLTSLSASALRALFGLAAGGVCLSIDDFGRGTGSLLALRDLPVQEFKMYPGFVARICHSEADAAIVAALTSLGRRLGKTVIAKGVESAEQCQRLRSLGCEYAQGFYFAQALPAQELEDWRDLRLAEEGARQTLF